MHVNGTLAYRPPQQPGPGTPPPPSLFAATNRPAGAVRISASGAVSNAFAAAHAFNVGTATGGDVMTLGYHRGRPHRSLLVPIAGAAVGGLLFGLPGAVAGGVLGYVLAC